MNQIATLSDFRRASVADQASAALRQAIKQGSLGDPLPGEHHLARQLGISRSSLRIAMAQLAADGLIMRSCGRRARLKQSRRHHPRNAPPAVCVVYPASREFLLSAQSPVVLEMRANFATKGIGWEEAFDAKLDVPNPDHQLCALVAGRKHTCWLLLACVAPIQRWFARAGVPAFVVGSCVPGVDLPSVNFDFHAVGWHAAGAMVKNGHQHIGLLQPRRLLAGDFNTIKGFLSYIAKAAPHTTITRILIDSNFSNLRTKLGQLAATRQRPTALLSVNLACTLSAMVNLLQCGLRIPDDISLVSRDSHPIIDASLQDITRYRGVSLRLANRAVRVAQALLAGHHVPLKPSLITPTFIPGRTLAVAPVAPKPPR